MLNTTIFHGGVAFVLKVVCGAYDGKASKLTGHCRASPQTGVFSSGYRTLEKSVTERPVSIDFSNVET